jgi:DNA-directed RNA polymerase subunit omega
MAERPPTMMYPPVEDLLDKVDSKFTLVALAARRGRQINSYYNGLGSEGIGTIVPPQVASTSRKSLSIALEEIAAGKIQYVEPSELEAAEAAAAADMAEMTEPEA